MQNIAKKGFTLMEVLTAVLIMSMMMIAVISFIDYTSTIWRTGQTTVNSKNYSRMFFDLLNQELLNAESIGNEVKDDPYKFLFFLSKEKPRSIYFNKDENKIYLYKSDAADTENHISKDTGKKSTNFDANDKEILLANNVNDLIIKRLSISTIQATLVIQSNEEDEDGKHDIISSDTMILYAPMVRQE